MALDAISVIDYPCTNKMCAGKQASVGARIEKARLRAGYKVATRFADAIGVRAHVLWRYENGRALPRIGTLAKIARHAGVRMEWLATGEGRMSESSTSCSIED